MLSSRIFLHVPALTRSQVAEIGIRMLSAQSAGKKKKVVIDKNADKYLESIIDERSIEYYLDAEKRKSLNSMKCRYQNWMSEYNIKKRMKAYNKNELFGSIPGMFRVLQEFYVSNTIANASVVLTPPVMKELKMVSHPVYPRRVLESYYKNLVHVGYSLSYLDEPIDLMQIRVAKMKDVYFGQLTLGIKAVEDVYGWTNRNKRILLPHEFTEELPSLCKEELPVEAIHSEWKVNEDTEHNKYFYNTLTKESSWTDPTAYANRRRYRAYCIVIEKPLFSTMGNWRFRKI